MLPNCQVAPRNFHSHSSEDSRIYTCSSCLSTLYNYITTNAHTTAVNIITHIVLTTASVSGAAGVQTAKLGADVGHVKIKRAAALVSNITHLSDWDISLHDTYADRDGFDNRTIIGSELRDWMVGNQTTDVAFMIYDGGDGVDVNILAYAARQRYLALPYPDHSPAAASNLTTRNLDYQSHASSFAANGAGIKLSMQKVIDRKSPSAWEADATGISKSVVITSKTPRMSGTSRYSLIMD